MRLPEIGAGSEHRVLFDEAKSDVVKLTLPGVYGDHYEIVADRITQFCCTPAEYLLRLRHWEKLFSTAPLPLGLTDVGQIISRQKFISGVQPTQDAVGSVFPECRCGGGEAALLALEEGHAGRAAGDMDRRCALR